jgi:hypothetical protein
MSGPEDIRSLPLLILPGIESHYFSPACSNLARTFLKLFWITACSYQRGRKSYIIMIPSLKTRKKE